MVFVVTRGCVSSSSRLWPRDKRSGVLIGRCHNTVWLTRRVGCWLMRQGWFIAHVRSVAARISLLQYLLKAIPFQRPWRTFLLWRYSHGLKAACMSNLLLMECQQYVRCVIRRRWPSRFRCTALINRILGKICDKCVICGLWRHQPLSISCA